MEFFYFFVSEYSLTVLAIIFLVVKWDILKFHFFYYYNNYIKNLQGLHLHKQVNFDIISIDKRK